MERSEAPAPLFRPSILVALYAGLSLAMVAPVFAVAVPGLGDTLNHLARIDIMDRIGRDPVLRRFYETGWRFVPYYGMDVPVLLLTKIMGIYAAGRVFVALCILMPVAAAAVLRRAVFGRVGAVPLLGFVFGYNAVLAYGFLNYLWSAGLAVMLFAGWIAAARWGIWRRAAMFSGALVLLYLCHLFAAAAYCLMVAGAEIGLAARCGFRPPERVALQWAAAASQALPLVLLAAATAGQAELGSAHVTSFGSALGRVAALLSPFFFPGAGALVALAMLLILAGLLLAPRVRWAAAVWPAVMAVGAAAVVTPKILLNVWGSDLRFPIVVVMLALGAVSRGPRIGVRTGRAIVAVAVALAVGKAAAAYGVLAGVDAQVTQMRRLVAALPVGSRLLVVDEGSGTAKLRLVPDVFTGHLAMVAAIDRDAFVPFLFTGVSAVRLTPALRASGSVNGGTIGVRDLWAGLAAHDAPGEAAPSRLGGQVYWRDWPAKFDYVLVEHFGDGTGVLPPFLAPVAHAGIADLYKVGAAR